MWVMANNSPASLVVSLSRTGFATLSEKRTTFDSLPAEHFALPPCTTEILITSDDIYKENHHRCKTVQLSPCRFQKCFVQPVDKRCMLFLKLSAPSLANGDNSAYRERTQLSGGSLSIS